MKKCMFLLCLPMTYNYGYQIKGLILLTYRRSNELAGDLTKSCCIEDKTLDPVFRDVFKQLSAPYGIQNEKEKVKKQLLVQIEIMKSNLMNMASLNISSQ